MVHAIITLVGELHKGNASELEIFVTTPSKDLNIGQQGAFWFVGTMVIVWLDCYFTSQLKKAQESRLADKVVSMPVLPHCISAALSALYPNLAIEIGACLALSGFHRQNDVWIGWPFMLCVSVIPILACLPAVLFWGTVYWEREGTNLEEVTRTLRGLPGRSSMKSFVFVFLSLNCFLCAVSVLCVIFFLLIHHSCISVFLTYLYFTVSPMPIFQFFSFFHSYLFFTHSDSTC